MKTNQIKKIATSHKKAANKKGFLKKTKQDTANQIILFRQ